MWNGKRLGNADSAEIIQILNKRHVHFFRRMIRDPPDTTNHLLFASTNPQIASWTLRPRAPVCGVSGWAEPSQRFSDVLRENVCLCKKPQRPGAGKYYKPERMRDSTEREREGGRGTLPPSPVGSACRGLPSWGEQSWTDSLRNVSTPKRLFVLSDHQPAQNKERTSMFGGRGVWPQTETVCDCVCCV